MQPYRTLEIAAMRQLAIDLFPLSPHDRLVGLIGADHPLLGGIKTIGDSGAIGAYIGSMASRLQGGPNSKVHDLDFVPARDALNLQRLVNGLTALGVRRRNWADTQDLGLPSVDDFEGEDLWLVQYAGNGLAIDVYLEAAGIGGYKEMSGACDELVVADTHIRIPKIEVLKAIREGSMAKTQARIVATPEDLRNQQQRLMKEGRALTVLEIAEEVATAELMSVDYEPPRLELP